MMIFFYDLPNMQCKLYFASVCRHMVTLILLVFTITYFYVYLNQCDLYCYDYLDP